MDLILWRHAEAEDGIDDLQRPLTAKGHQQAALSAAWLKTHLPTSCRLWVSEAVRSQQTAVYLDKNTQQVPPLNPGRPAAALPALLRSYSENAPLVWVGHQPWIGQLCAWLLNGDWHASVYWSVKKSAFWWFEVGFDDAHNQHSAKLKATLTPALLKKG